MEEKKILLKVYITGTDLVGLDQKKFILMNGIVVDITMLLSNRNRNI